ncbi:protein-L-isoaspartate O-methyltransferase [Aureimonas fodinaquatilis]|uniref:Protein-L-isoaspartate O-methyltransferase n=1 Tax=Aureimonas fodinaquatilis TaxID=2565783 RepID=A0A5B0DV61_9HYPH|nr:protein-L-isoaspartate O-methyltransferase [Aureimonas fodinaquatilis]KAA0970707.1 protein-L-isoaspartate O-methyltransferase [Aureimonas fodinaquatilis]
MGTAGNSRKALVMDFVQARTKMVDNQVRTVDVTDHDILRALLTVPREIFVPESKRPFAYMGGEIALGGGRHLMEVAPFARLLQLAEIEKDDVVLNIGCGAGYSAAVLSHLAASVVAVEEDPALAQAASDALASLGIVSAVVVQAPLAEGYAKEGPYDVIIIDGGVDQVPAALFEQLKERGRLVVIEGRGFSAAAKLYSKEGGVVSGRFAFNYGVSQLPGFGLKPEFVF